MSQQTTPENRVRILAGRLARFVGVGAANTVATLLLYQLLLLFCDYRTAYALSFLAGIIFTALASSRFVFKSKLTARRLAAFAAFYGVSFLLGLGLLIVLVNYVHLSKQAAPIVVVLIMLPFNYLGARFALGRFSG